MCTSTRHSENKQLIGKVRNAIRIQAFFRGYQVRQQLIPIVDAILKELKEELRRKNCASTHIQAIVRGYLCRIHYRRLAIAEPFGSPRRAHLNKDAAASRNDDSCHHNAGPFSTTCKEMGQPPSMGVLHPSKSPRRLKVFQASPLVYYSSSNRNRNPLPDRIDMDLEQRIFRQALNEYNFPCDFDIGTIRRFKEFLGNDEYKAVQFSCHGHEAYLAFESGWGEMDYLETSVLKRLVEESAPKRLQLAVVAACHSDSIGRAFAAAGVPHVVCCARQFELLLDDAAVVFTSSLYKFLACGMTIQRAFDLANLQLSADPRYPSQEFSLLPEDGNHDVAIFPRTSTAGFLLPTHPPRPNSFPDLPFDFFYPSDDLYPTVQAIRHNRLTRVKGPPQIGKTTLVTECCHYLKHRIRVIDIDMILWKSVHEQPQVNTSSIDADFGKLCQHWRNDSSPSTHAIRQCGLSVIDFLKDRRSLLVIEAKRLPRIGIRKLNKFLRQLISGTKHLKVVVICGANDCDAGDLGDFCVTTDIIVNGLCMTSTVRLFAQYCDHVDNGDELWRHLSPKGHRTASLSRSHTKILKMLGGRNPKNVFCTARNMTRDQYDILRELASYDSPDLLQTRAELLLLDFEFNRRIDFRISKDDTASWLEKKHKAVTCLLEEFQDPQALSSAWKLQFEELLKGENESNETWSLLHQKLKDVQAGVDKEKDAIISWLTDSRSSLFSTLIRNGDIQVAEKLVFATGSSLQDSARHSSEALDLQVSKDILESKYGVIACTEELRKKYNEFLLDRNFKNAESIEIHLRLLEDLDCLYLSKSDLHFFSSRLKGIMDHLVESSSIVRAKAMDELRNMLDDAVYRESRAETRGPLDLECSSRAIKIVASATATELQQCPQSLNEDIIIKLRRKRKKVSDMIDNLLDNIMRLKESCSGNDETKANGRTASLNASSFNTL